MFHAIGDSHVRIFKFLNKTGLLKTKFNICSVTGATNIGLSSKESKSGANRIFESYLNEKVNFGDKVVFMCGEGDCVYVIWTRMEKYKTSIKEQFDISLKNYFELIESFYKKTRSKIIVCDTPYPTLRTGDRNGEVANIRFDIGKRYTQEERTKLTFEYNDKIKEFCFNKGFQHLDYRKEIINLKTGLIFDKFRNKTKPYDHHYEDIEFAMILSSKLNGIDIRNR